MIVAMLEDSDGGFFDDSGTLCVSGELSSEPTHLSATSGDAPGESSSLRLRLPFSTIPCHQTLWLAQI